MRIYQWQHHRKERSQQKLYSNWDHMEYIPDRIVYGNICWHLSYRTICCNSEIKGKCTRHMWISDSTRKILIHISLSDGLKGLVTNDQTELWEKEKIFYEIRGHFIKGFKAITRGIMRDLQSIKLWIDFLYYVMKYFLAGTPKYDHFRAHYID